MLPFPARSLIVSCQAGAESALHGPAPMAAHGRRGRARRRRGIRANGPADVAAIRAAVDLPIIGIRKLGDRTGRVHHALRRRGRRGREGRRRGRGAGRHPPAPAGRQHARRRRSPRSTSGTARR